MPPPMPPQQGSRAGLITALVVFVILTLLFAVFYFQERGLRAQAEKADADTRSSYTGIAPSDLTDPKLTSYREAAKDNTFGAESAFEVAVHRENLLAQAITGQAGVEADKAKQMAEGALNETQNILAQANIKPGDRGLAVSPNDSLARALVKFANSYVELEKQKKAAEAATAAARAENASLVQAHEQQVATLTADIKKTQDEVAARQADLDALTQKQATAMAEVGTNTSEQLNVLNDQVKAAETQIATLNQTVGTLESERKRLQGALASYRMDPRDNTVRRADGKITRVPGNGTCYIDLGLSDGLPAGITFEVYDQVNGIPSLNADLEGLDDETARRTREANARVATAAARNAGAGGVTGAAAAVAAPKDRFESQLPAGSKGSIEVIRVGPGTSECRIIGMEPGQFIREGDLIANLVYNKEVKFKFGVFGEFDLDYNGVPTMNDTTTIRRLIGQWGGTVADANQPEDITPDLDFVVIGIAPEVPVLSVEEQNDPIAMDRVQKAKDARTRYDAVLDRAREYSVPVLNQTRFLYYTGYFDQRSR